MLKDTLRTDLTDAMRRRDDIAVSTLRLALAAVTNAEVAGDAARELSDDEVIGVLTTEVRKRTEAADLYDQAGRTELAAKERAEAEILGRYLPAALSDDELSAIVDEEVAAAAAAGATGPKAMGTVVKAVRARAGAGADGARIAVLVKSRLA